VRPLSFWLGFKSREQRTGHMIGVDTGGGGRAVRPRRLRLSASTVCALGCPGCPNPRGEIAETLGAGFLKAAVFEDLLASNPWVREIELSGWGEPFLNPEMPAIVKVAASRGVRLTADNGSTLNGISDELIDALVRYRFRRITCTIDGASQESYAAYRKHGDFEAVMTALRRIKSLKAELGSPYPQLAWQFVVFGHNEHEIPEARRLADELGMVFRLKESWDPELSPVRDSETVDEQHRRVGTFRHLLKMTSPDSAGSVFCHHLWEEPQVNWDGRMLGCCCNHTAAFEGNAFTDDLFELINSRQMRKARSMLVGDSEPDPDVPCSSCDVYLEMRSTGQYLTRGLPRELFRLARFVYNEMGVRKLLQRGAPTIGGGEEG
jgi:MoaA/NifB/PqqE/SkfB family radical SAM enzyme